MDYSNKPINYNFGLDIDELIRVRETSKYNLIQSKMTLLESGAKTITNGELSALPSLNKEEYIKCSNQEFYWEAEYKDGSILKQFEGTKQHHYGNIDFDKLKVIKWVSNFIVETSNVDKRIIISLDWESGSWSFYNGLVPQEVKNLLWDNNEFLVNDNKKLILKMVKRESQSVGFPSNTISETTRYYRYILGWESKNKKIVLCIEPNGYTHLWHE